MNLKAVIHNEAASVFLNPDEFAEYISLDDVPETPALCDWSVTPGGEHLYGSTGDPLGVNTVQAVVTLGEGVIPKPEPGQELTVNGQYWIVREASCASGLMTLKLFRHVG